jgi:glucose/mannose-6-phosphate isomerase
VTLPVDSLGMWEATAGLPEQITTALAATAGLAGPAVAGPITNVVVLGMGGSGVAGDVLAAIAGPEMAVPVTVVKSYGLPAFVGPDSLVFAVSCSGDTEATVAAAAAARMAGASMVTVAGGGELARLAATRARPWWRCRPAFPSPGRHSVPWPSRPWSSSSSWAC